MSRRDLAVLLGALGGALGIAALSGCNENAASPSPEHLGKLAEALTSNPTVLSVASVLGAAPPNPRVGDLAANGGPGSTVGTPIAASVVIAEYCVRAGDGGGGLFYWNTAGAVDDGGVNIVPGNNRPGASGPCWTRLFSGPVNVRWFGAIGDGVAIDGGNPGISAIDLAIAFALLTPLSGGAANRSVYLPPGLYVVVGTLSINDRLTIYGESFSATRLRAKFTDNTKALFNLGIDSIVVRDLTIEPFYDTHNTYYNTWNGFAFSNAQACVVHRCQIILPYKGMVLGSGSCDTQDIWVSISAASAVGIDFSATPAGGFSNNSHIRILSEISCISQSSGTGVIFGGWGGTIEGGEIQTANCGIQLNKGNTVKDVDVEFVNISIHAMGVGNVIIGGQFGFGSPQVDTAGGLIFIGLDSTGNIASDILVPGALSFTPTTPLSTLKPVLASCRLASDQVVYAGNRAPVNFSVIDWDSNNGFQGGSAFPSYKCPMPGLYRVSGTLSLNGTVSGVAVVSVLVNGVPTKSSVAQMVSSTYVNANILADVLCNANDLIGIGVLNDTSGQLTIAASFSPQWMNISRVPGS